MPQVARITDPNTAHCSGHEMAEGSSTWFCEGLGVCRHGDSTTGHLTDIADPCPPHSSTVNPPDRGWYCDGKLIAAVGDPHCTNIAGGASYWGIG